MIKNIEFIEVLSDVGAGTRGAAFGASVLRINDKRKHHQIFSAMPTRISNKLTQEGFSSAYGKNIETIVDTCTKISTAVCQSIIGGNYPLLISGDHSNSAGTIAGIKKAKPDSTLGVVWIDAHSDLHSPFTSPSGNLHGMPLAASIGEDNMENAKRKIDDKTHSFWTKYKNIGNISPKLKAKHIVYVSLRDFENEETCLIEKYEIKHFNTCSLLNFGMEKVVSQIFDALEECSDIYVSFDVDSLDSAISKGTGLPVKGGLMPWEAELLTHLLLCNPKVTAFEITEFNPFLDVQNETAHIIRGILEKAVMTLKNQTYPESYCSDIAFGHVV